MKANPDPNNPIEVTLGQVFTISLESIPSAGYKWNVEYDPKIIDLIKPKKYVPYSSAVGTVGGSGQEIFEFKTRQSGETLFTAKYQRGKQTPMETKIFRILIRQ